MTNTITKGKEQLQREIQSFIQEAHSHLGLSEIESEAKARHEAQALFANMGDSNINQLAEMHASLAKVSRVLPKKKFPADFPRYASEKEKIQWIKQQCASELKALPDNVSAGEVKRVFDKYHEPLVSNARKYGITSEQTFRAAAMLERLLERYQLACPQYGTDEILSKNQQILVGCNQRLAQLNAALATATDSSQCAEIKKKIAIEEKSIMLTESAMQTITPSVLSEPFWGDDVSSRTLYKEMKRLKLVKGRYDWHLIALFVSIAFVVAGLVALLILNF